jgi:hypothetical protein
MKPPCFASLNSICKFIMEVPYDLKLKIACLFTLLFIFSCKKENSNEYSKRLFVGGWNISTKNFFEASEHIIHEYPVNIDTMTRIFGKDGLLKPAQQHEIYINSTFLSFDSNSSLDVSIDELQDGEYSFLYKSEIVDLSTLKKITLSVHGEQLNSDKPIKDNDITVLIRLCSDTSLNDNYYEIERPIIISKKINTDLADMWPNDNFINLDINKLLKLENKRDSLNISKTTDFLILDSGYKLSIRNNPDLTKINRICIGIKNPGDSNNLNINDRSPKSIKICLY